MGPGQVERHCACCTSWQQGRRRILHCGAPQAVRAFLEKERKAAALEAAKASAADADGAAAAGGSAAAVQGLSPHASSDAGGFGVPVDDFDSEADTDYGSGSCVTDMNLSDSE